MKNPELSTASGELEKLTDLFSEDNCSIFAINDVIEDSTTGAELVRSLNSLKLFSKFTLERETPEYVRLVSTDCFGKRHYFRAEK